ncbi:hypothetical protein ACH24_03235 [Francisella persica ATCC VR-331]|uniref:Uncharacterized protein n=2 Tax=Francisella persica TaxID=954 RepID=A0AAC9EU84_9GAMM|nr:hypothetical protein ACH24_03235 [Francisella persica ATCC VR-331]ANH78030.1 hypothetical protein FSC845_06065 [Francisella persica ATCC VR-331]
MLALLTFIYNDFMESPLIDEFKIKVVVVLIDKKHRIVRKRNINFNGVNLKQLIQDKYTVKSEIYNDVNVGILGEAKYGAGVGYDDIIVT